MRQHFNGRYWRLFDGVFEAFHLLDWHLAVAVLIELSDDELRSFSTVMKFVHQQLDRLWPRYRAVAASRLLPVHIDVVSGRTHKSCRDHPLQPIQLNHLMLVLISAARVYVYICKRKLVVEGLMFCRCPFRHPVFNLPDRWDAPSKRIRSCFLNLARKNNFDISFTASQHFTGVILDLSRFEAL